MAEIESLCVVHIINKCHVGHEGNVNSLTEINAFEYGNAFFPPHPALRRFALK